MKRTITIITVLVTQFALANELMAASSVREDTSMFLVWMFLGMCALIVIVQLMPAMFLIFGMLKSLFPSNKQSPVNLQANGEK